MRLLGRDESRIDQIRRRCRGRFDHGAGKDLRIYAPGIIAEWLSNLTKTSDHSDRLKKAQADLAELKLEQLRGELVRVDDIAGDYESVGGELRQRIEQLCPVCQESMRGSLERLLREETKATEDTSSFQPARNTLR